MNLTNRKSRLLVLMALLAMLLAACAPALTGSAQTPTAGAAQSAPQPANTPTGAPTSAPTATVGGAATQTPAQSATTAPLPAAEAQKDLAKRLGLSLDQIKIISFEQVDWPNGCLGIVTPGMMCTDVIVPGYRVILEAGGSRYEYRTDLQGKQAKLANDKVAPGEKSPPTGVEIPLDPASIPVAVQKAREALAQQIQARPQDIQIVKIEAVEWPNGCLGVQMPGRMCTQVITPGYRVTFSYKDKQYEYHTDEGGGAVQQATAPLPQTSDKVITWEQVENNVCSRVEIGVKTAAFGTCSGSLTEAPVSKVRLEELRTLLGAYAPFQATTPSGSVFFNGQGAQQATPAEQRSIAEWAKLVRMEAESGRSGAAWGLAFGWHREGGIAGFCDDMGVYLSGWAQPSSCKGNQPTSGNSFRLNADQLAQLYGWVYQYQNFDYETKDPAGATDAMTIRLTFAGTGSEKASPEVQAEIAKFAADLYAMAPK